MRREGFLTVWDLPDTLFEMKRGPLGYFFPSSGTPVIDDAVGLVRGARHAAAAKALIDWLGSPEAQKLAAEKAYRLPARTDLPLEQMPEWARDVSTKLVAAKLDWERIGREGPRRAAQFTWSAAARVTRTALERAFRSPAGRPPRGPTSSAAS